MLVVAFFLCLVLKSFMLLAAFYLFMPFRSQNKEVAFYQGFQIGLFAKRTLELKSGTVKPE